MVQPFPKQLQCAKFSQDFECFFEYMYREKVVYVKNRTKIKNIKLPYVLLDQVQTVYKDYGPY